MNDPNIVETAVSTGLSIVGGGGLVGVMVRLLMGNIVKRLDAIDAILREDRKFGRELFVRIVNNESSTKALHSRLDALVTPPPKRRRPGSRPQRNKSIRS